ncbi:RNA 2',3'-cyclic phosphodiesterase [bacterium]|nr:RNA 2',3'-cyclic phosphodiesterase [bacterium]MCP5462942.1 RNA 2',3'-cyclic phosphodiesterase [bacterium]
MSNKELLRLFFAVEFPDTFRETITNFFLPYHRCSPLIKWIPAQNLHITIRFLGNLPSHQVSTLYSILQTVSDNITSFDLSVHSCGVFPSCIKPSVLWTGIAQGALECATIASMTNRLLCSHGFPNDSLSFKPHITVARTKKVTNQKKIIGLYDEILAESANQTFGTCAIQRISLIHSTLTQHGPIYSTVVSSPLKLSFS